MLDVSSRKRRRVFYQSTQWRRLRQKALERDHYECQWCAVEGRVMSADRTILEVDHIKELEHYPDLALDLDNLRTLCKEHHNQRHGRFQYRQSKQKLDRLFRQDEWWGEQVPPT